MSRPLVISDCDEVLLHMVAPFKDWLEESQGVRFELKGNNFATAMRWADSGETLAQEDIWKFLGGFFDTEMHRQMPIDGAVAGINRVAEAADVVILTNLNDERQAKRTSQLAEVGINARVFTNQGPKGPALQAILDEFRPSKAIFIDDLPQHHHSASETVPDISRLHMCGEPMIADHIDCAHKAGHAHARIDRWEDALPWLLEELERDPR
uniref:HAD family hydrolase n=1 Tax=uncultured Altererythrobacter sp. TaxID=500840 RepID=UPI002635B959|nr:HAD family hydrolase [uncultured Altererythrobacter sp.]